MTETQRLGKYQILEEIGRGGFATVFRALDTVLEREVALKVLKPGWTDDAKAVERFMREARAASRLDQPGIVTIYDVGEADGRLFIAMKLLPGQALDQRIKANGPLSWERTLAITQQVAEALDYAHAKDLVHRDIKPSNIIVTETDHAVLTDFGLVRGAEQASLSTGSTGGILGTPEYIPPEVWEGQPATKASDIYALACVVYEMLIGHPLFAAETGAAVMRKHVLVGPEFPVSWPPDVPGDVAEVLRKALAREQSQRYTTANEFAVELRECAGQAAKAQQAAEQETQRMQLEAEEIARKAREETARKIREEQEREAASLAAAALTKKVEQEAEERKQQQATITAEEKAKRESEKHEQQLQKVVSRRSSPRPKWIKWIVYGLATVSALAIIFVLVVSRGHPFAEPRQPSTPTEMPTAASAPTMATTSAGTSPSNVGGRIIFPLTVNTNQTEWHIMNSDGSNVTRFDPSSVVLPHPDVSPDGKNKVYWKPSPQNANSLEIFVSNIDGSDEQQLTNDQKHDHGAMWSPDGNYIYFTSDRSSKYDIYRMTPDGRFQEELTRSYGDNILFGTVSISNWSPNNNTILFFSARDFDSGDIYVMNPDGSNQIRLTNDKAYDTCPVWSPDGKRIAFISDRNGGYDVYTMAADGTDVTQLTHSRNIYPNIGLDWIP